MISSLEIRNIIESAFLPLQCRCTDAQDGSLTVHVSNPRTGHVELLVAGISLASLNGARAIADLVAELRTELKNNQRHTPERVAKAGERT